MTTAPRLFTTDDAAVAREAALAALRAGEVVALPTETVYGLAVRADRRAPLARLAELKRRPADLAFTWHVGDDHEAALGRFPDPWQSARRLAQRYWPGPLTLVLHGVARGVEELAREGWTGIRRPADPFTSGVLTAAEFPIAMSSANRHGEAPATAAAVIAGGFSGDEVALVVDGGPTRLAEASTVLALGPGRFTLLREGLIDIAALRAAAGLRLAFVCTGNTCRSPMAEALARRAIATRFAVPPTRLHEFGFAVASFGAFAPIGAPASEEAVRAMRERGLDISAHRARIAERDALRTFDRIYGLTAAHVALLADRLGEDAPLDVLDPDGGDIPDPIGRGREAYEQTAEALSTAIEKRLQEWV